jgi:hypothetical protein
MGAAASPDAPCRGRGQQSTDRGRFRQRPRFAQLRQPAGSATHPPTLRWPNNLWRRRGAWLQQHAARSRVNGSSREHAATSCSTPQQHEAPPTHRVHLNSGWFEEPQLSSLHSQRGGVPHPCIPATAGERRLARMQHTRVARHAGDSTQASRGSGLHARTHGRARAWGATPCTHASTPTERP